MDTTLLGSIGVGLVWGWLLGGAADTIRGWINVLSVLLATSLLSLGVYWLASWSGIEFSVGALVLALLLHLGWRRSLRQRFDHPT